MMNKIKLSYLMLVEQLLMSAFLVFQLVLLLIVENLLLASYNNRYMLYSPYGRILEQDGFFVYSLNGETDFSQLYEYTFEDIYTIKKMLLFDGVEQITVVLVPDEIYNKLTLPLQKGSYSNKSSSFSAVAVPAHNKDIIGKQFCISEDKYLTVCGTLTNPTYIPSYGKCNTDLTFSDWYQSVSSDSNEGITLVTSQVCIDNLKDEKLSNLIVTHDFGAIATVSDNTSETELNRIKCELEKDFWVVSLSEISENSQNYIDFQVKKYLPIGIVAASVIIMGIIGGFEIFTLRNLHKHSIYYLCGAKKRNLLELCLISILLLITISLLCCGILYSFLKTSGANAYFGFVFDLNNLIITFVTISAIIILSCASAFVSVVSKTTTKILAEDKV